MKLESFKLISPNRVECLFSDDLYFYQCQLTPANFLVAQNATFHTTDWLDQNACYIY